MAEDLKEREKRFIRERIVPRKRYKKVLGILGAVIGSALLFGASSGAVFYLMQESLNKNEVPESRIEPIIIARDDVSLSPESTASSEEKESTARETEAASSAESAASESGSEESTDNTNPESTEEGGETSASDGESGASPSETTAAPVEPTEETEAPLPDLRTRAEMIRNSLVSITVKESSATDWFASAILKTWQHLGVLIAENSEYVLVLTKAAGLNAEGAQITVSIGDTAVEAEYQRGDSETGLSILRVEKARLEGGYELLPLGNSFNLTSSDPVWFYGLTDGNGSGLNEGMITYLEGHRPVTDGYLQLIMTGMLHFPGETGILLNMDNELVGLVSDESCQQGVSITAWGISPLKYLLEDMCSSQGTAYLGIRCVDVTAEDAEVLGVPSGLYIQEIAENSPAYLAGLLPGDRVIKVDAGAVNTNHVLQVWMDKLEPGTEIAIGIERRGPEGYEPLEILVTPGERR